MTRAGDLPPARLFKESTEGADERWGPDRLAALESKLDQVCEAVTQLTALVAAGTGRTDDQGGQGEGPTLPPDRLGVPEHVPSSGARTRTVGDGDGAFGQTGCSSSAW